MFPRIISEVWDALLFVINGRPADPKEFATDPPKWWFKGATPEQIPDGKERLRPKDGGHIVGYGEGGFIYSSGESRAEREGWVEVENGNEVTEQDYGEMLNYSPKIKLTNVTLAKRIKPLWKKGKKPKDIALMLSISESYAKHYCIAFERAAEAQQNTPLSEK